MAANNLRILYKNAVTAVTADSVSAPNLLNDYKSQTTTGTTFVITTSSLTGSVVLVAMLPELTGSVTMTVTGQTAVVESTTSLVANNQIGYGGGKYVAKYIALGSATTSFTVTFSQAVKVSRFIVGNYWTPQFNTSYGIELGYTDASDYERLQSGDLYTINAPRNKYLTFNLEYLVDAEKFKMFDIIKSVGKSKPLFISVFPEDTDKEKEQMYSIYGKLSNMPGITYALFTKYTTSLNLEEV